MPIEMEAVNYTEQQIATHGMGFPRDAFVALRDVFNDGEQWQD